MVIGVWNKLYEVTTSTMPNNSTSRFEHRFTTTSDNSESLRSADNVQYDVSFRSIYHPEEQFDIPDEWNASNYRPLEKYYRFENDHCFVKTSKISRPGSDDIFVVIYNKPFGGVWGVHEEFEEWSDAVERVNEVMAMHVNLPPMDDDDESRSPGFDLV